MKKQFNPKSKRLRAKNKVDLILGIAAIAFLAAVAIAVCLAPPAP